ncbi:MAG: carboxylating nicotinate-nucleotide diphosphorylase [Pirellulaceae bacterium]|nr:carboxylating nicotinate-nucleotide diphosphorylase [Pirellulaceae bacterium]
MNESPATPDYRQVQWDDELEHHLRLLIRLAVLEDLDRYHDWTTLALVPAGAEGAAAVVSRQPGALAGLAAIPVILDEMNAQVTWSPTAQDGAPAQAGQSLGTLSGSSRDLLVVERPLLNLVGRLSGIATLTRQYVDQVAGSTARIYDTRKTTPGWRRLEKYAVRCGGGSNHRGGLYDGILIKDNHLATRDNQEAASPAAALRQVRRFIEQYQADNPMPENLLVEIEVDTLDQLADALAATPDIVLLDNMPAEMLREAVACRDRLSPATQLEASGGVTLEQLAAIATTGVERISVGALTHAASALDIGLDWIDGERRD